jgi:hypothetical protein
VSFLYPSSYYEELQRRMLTLLALETNALVDKGFSSEDAREYARATPRVNVLNFSPGFLPGEDLYSKLFRALEAARLEGAPYTDVVIDGLQNLALQFPGARDADVLWPIVFGTLARANVSTVSTFTSLELMGGRPDRSATLPEEGEFRLKAHLPLLHALVQSSDYVLNVVRNPEDGGYELSVTSAVDREPPRERALWDRHGLFLRGVIGRETP